VADTLEGMPPERLSSLDASFLYLERPSMHMHVAGISMLDPRPDGPLSYDDVQRVVEARLHLAPRCDSGCSVCPAISRGRCGSTTIIFDLDFQPASFGDPIAGGRFQLERAVGRVLSRPLDPAKPLWSSTSSGCPRAPAHGVRAVEDAPCARPTASPGM
jgi:hypothetical protein